MCLNMEKTAYEKLPEINTKVLTVFEYHDHSILYAKRENNHSQPEISESFISDAPLKFGALVEEYKTVDEQIAAIRSRVCKDTIADVVMVIVFQMFMTLDGYNNLKKMCPNMSEEELVLQIFKNSLYTGGIVVRSVFPVVVNGTVDINKMRS